MIDNRFIKPQIAALERYNATSEEKGILMNANESPFNIPTKILDEFESKLSSLLFNRYPDTDAKSLRATCANIYNISPDMVTFGVGSDDLIDIIFKSTLENRKLLVMSPSFSMYNFYNYLNGGEICYVKARSDMQFYVEDIINQIKLENPFVTLICNPNNPTGQKFSKDEIKQILDSTKGLVLVDEAYQEFASTSAIDLVSKYDNLVILKTFSKAYSLAALRLGYVISNPSFIQMIDSVKSPYRVNSINLLLGELVLKNKDLYEDNISFLKEEVLRAQASLMKISKLTIYKSSANFVFFKAEEGLKDYLLAKGIIVRFFVIDGSFYIRASMSTKEDNDLFIKEVYNYYEMR